MSKESFEEYNLKVIQEKLNEIQRQLVTLHKYMYSLGAKTADSPTAKDTVQTKK